MCGSGGMFILDIVITDGGIERVWESENGMSLLLSVSWALLELFRNVARVFCLKPGGPIWT